MFHRALSHRKLTFASVMSFVGYDYVRPISKVNGVLEEEELDDSNLAGSYYE